MEILRDIARTLENGDSTAVKELLREALALDIPPETILNKGLIKGMEAVGKKFKENEIFIPEVLIASRAMKSAMNIIKPYLIEEGIQSKGKIVLGTIKGDLHDIGKKIVSIVLEREGYEIIDIGIDVPKEKFINVLRKENPDILGMSALLTTTMSYMRDVIEAVRAEGFRKHINIILGGAPITQTFADEIGADGYAPEAISAVDLVADILEHQTSKGQ
jgi:5-methyltetrahydrofolate--homocysteine methyltransferase